MRLLVAWLVLGCICSWADLNPEKLQPVNPPSVKEMKDALDRGVTFLIETQHKDGSWGSPEKTALFEDGFLNARYAFQAAVTSIALSSLIEVGDKRADRAIELAKAWLLKTLPGVKRCSTWEVYNVWTYAFGIQALVRMLKISPESERAKIVEVIKSQIKLLIRNESIYGGWGYYDESVFRKPEADPTSFTTSTALIALYEAKQAGIDVPGDIIKRGIGIVQKQRMPGFNYSYSRNEIWNGVRGWDNDSRKEGKGGSVNVLGGSLGRSQVCNLALRLWGDTAVTDDVLKTWLTKLFNHHFWIDAGRKRPTPHASYYSVAAYFFYYGHYYASLVIELLPENERKPFKEHMARILVDRQETDGSWWDWPIYNYHQPYGTGFALMALKRAME